MNDGGSVFVAALSGVFVSVFLILISMDGVTLQWAFLGALFSTVGVATIRYIGEHIE